MEKLKIKSFPVFLIMLLLAVSPFFQSCNKDDDADATPVVDYIRPTDPDKSDSLLSGAYLGNVIAIMGKNLQNVNKVMFNDQEAYLNTSFITDFSIIVTVPTEIPGVVTNEITLVTKSGIEAKYPFFVLVPAPRLDGMLCEYVADGADAVIQGNYFIDDPNVPLEVFFPGNIPGVVKSVELNKVVVTVPAGAGVGPLAVKSIYGTSRSSFYFRDDRNIILNWEDLNAAGGWRSGIISNSTPDPINENYVEFDGFMKGDNSTWNEDPFSFNLWNKYNGRPDIPFYSDDLNGAVLKFECYVLEPWKAGALQMIFTPYNLTNNAGEQKQNNDYIANTSVPRGLWRPWSSTGTFVTEGWITVTIPLSEFKFTHTGGECANKLTNDMLGGLTFFVYHGGIEGEDCNVHMVIDNIRIVPQ